VSARDEIALVHKKNGSYRRRGPANTKRRGVGIGDGVLPAEESRRCTRFLASPLLSTPERPWPMPNGGSGALVVGKIIFQSPAQRSFIPHGDVNIRAVWNQSAAPRTDFAMGNAVR